MPLAFGLVTSSGSMGLGSTKKQDRREKQISLVIAAVAAASLLIVILAFIIHVALDIQEKDDQQTG